MSSTSRRRGRRDPGHTAGEPVKIGRSTRKAASQKALENLLNGGVDPSQIDPITILQSIAIDASSPAVARVNACRILLLGAGRRLRADASSQDILDPVTQRALRMLNTPKRVQ
jgi:hypothetical protein